MSSAKALRRCWPALLLVFALTAGTAQAVSLGKIEVASHLGEPFFAEVPLTLEADESITSVFVEPAAPADYRILEIYRDPALNAIRADVESDTRGPRVKLTSDSAVNAPFFNLVLKLRYGRATHFKKFPIFLDLPQVTLAPAEAKAAAPEEKQAAIEAAKKTAAEEAEFQPFSGWARSSRYGPMVYGDTVATVARRLRVDKRYSLPQVMVALFEKNRDKFDKGNINLIKAGTYLDVPSAAEVEANSPEAASNIIREHERQWNALKQEPRYAAVAEAQKQRYSKRVRVAKTAIGVPSSREGAAALAPGEQAVEGETAGAANVPPAGEQAAAEAEAVPALASLREENAALKERLQQAEEKISALSAQSPDAELAASAQRIKRLELSLARLRTELDTARQQAAQPDPMQTWMNYGLMATVVLLLLAIAYLLRRERAHPAAEAALVPETPPAQAVEKQPVIPAAAFGGDAVAEEHPAGGEEEILVPDLTERDTSEMEAFAEGHEEAPDPNVDYLAEADVYMRYGMEDEALRHVRLAVRQRPDNVDAHVKLAQLLHNRGDQEGQEQAVKVAKAALSGDALAQFNSQIEALGPGGEAAMEEVPVELPETGGEGGETAGFGALAEEEGGETAAEAELAERQTGEPAAVAEEGEEEEKAFDFGAFAEEGTGEAGLAEGQAEEATVHEEEGEAGTAIDLSDIEWPEGESLEAVLGEEPAAEPEAGEETAAPEDVSEEEAVAAREEALDLGDVELPEEGGEELGEEPKETPELEATIALDRSQALAEEEAEAPAEEDEAAAVTAEEGLEFDLSDIELPQEKESGGPAVEEKTAAAPEDEAELLDIDLETEVAAQQGGESGEAGGETPGEEVEIADDLADLHAELEAGELEGGSEDTGQEEEVAVLPEAAAELDVSQELEELLSELDVEAGEPTEVEVASEGGELSVEALAIDTGKSQLAEGQLDEAHQSFTSALAGKQRPQALLGLAEVAIRRGDHDEARQLLAEAEAVVDEAGREWFERLQEQLRQ